MALSAFGRPAQVRQNDTLKAEYVRLEAENAAADYSLTDRYMLLRHAERLNPSNVFIAGAAAEYEIYLDLALNPGPAMPSYGKLQRRFYAKPGVAPYADTYARLVDLLEQHDDAIAMWELLDSLQPSRTDPAMYLARELTNKGSLQNDTAAILRAIAIYDRLQRTQPANIAISTPKVLASHMLGDTAACLSEIMRIRREAPADRRVLVTTSRLYRIFDLPDSAAVILEEAGRLYPDDGLVSSERARFFHDTGDSVNYRREVFKAIESTGLDFDQKFELFGIFLGNAVMDSVEHPDVARLFAVFQETNPGEPNLHRIYGEYLVHKNNFAGAAEQYRYARDLDPTDRDVWDNYLMALAQTGDSDVIHNEAHQAAERFRSDLYAALLAASASYTRDNYPEAIAVLDSVVFLPTHSRSAVGHVYALKGDIYSRIEMTDSALVNYERAIAADADNHMALNNAAYFMAVKERDLPRAEIYASIACAAEPENATFLDTYAWVLFKRREYARALEMINRTLAVIEQGAEAAEESGEQSDGEEEGNSNFDIYSHAGDIFFMSGQPDKAVEYWQKALELNPDDELVARKVANRAYYYE